MNTAPAGIPNNERERFEALHVHEILDAVPEQSFDDLTLIASAVCCAPISLVSMMDGDCQQFKAHRGIDLDLKPRDMSFCTHTILEPERILEVPDAAADERFADNPMVVGEPHIRFYAGVALVTNEGHALGALCVLDRKPRRLEPEQRAALTALARRAAAQLKLRSTQHALQRALASARAYQSELEDYQSRLHLLNSRLRTQAVTDPLTGLYNRLELTQRLDQAVAAADRTGDALSLLLIDVDHFKSLNDTFGHLAGDDTLRRLAQIIRGAVREADTVARYGGEEFLAIVPSTPSEGAAALAERIRHHIESAAWSHRAVTVSVGVVTRYGGTPHCEADRLIHDADLALYRAKAAGRNCVRATEEISA